MIELVSINDCVSHFEVLLESKHDGHSITEHVLEFTINRDENSINVLPKTDDYDYVSDLTARDIILYPIFREQLNKIIYGHDKNSNTIMAGFPYKHIKASGDYEWILNELVDKK